jgi:ribosomal protein S18 acetylase RimI-like enzyme
VASEWHGRGIAHQLMAAALELMQARRCDAAWLGVWEHNPRAIAFYHKFGFAEVGELPFSLGNDSQRDLVMARPLEAS